MLIRSFCCTFLIVFVLFQNSANASKNQVKEIDKYYERYELFERLGLPTLAINQLKWIYSLNPKNQPVKEKLSRLIQTQTIYYLHESMRFQKLGRDEAALKSIEKALAFDPKNKEAKKFKDSLLKKKQTKTGMRELVDSDYQAGLKAYEDTQYDAALVYFIKVINMDPYHDGALLYIEKIGQKKGIE